jgi:DNA repair ATPase RecN
MEIARMLDGENYSQLTMEHAREMIAKTKQGDGSVVWLKGTQ